MNDRLLPIDGETEGRDAWPRRGQAHRWVPAAVAVVALMAASSVMGALVARALTRTQSTSPAPACDPEAYTNDFFQRALTDGPTCPEPTGPDILSALFANASTVTDDAGVRAALAAYDTWLATAAAELATVVWGTFHS